MLEKALAPFNTFKFHVFFWKRASRLKGVLDCVKHCLLLLESIAFPEWSPAVILAFSKSGDGEGFASLSAETWGSLCDGGI